MNKFRDVGKDNSITSEEKVFIQRRIVSCEENNEEIPWPLQMTRANLVVLKFVHIAFAEYADMLKRWDDDLYIDENNEKYNERKAVTYLSMASKLCNCLNMKRTYHGSALLKALSLMRLYQEKREKHCKSEVLYNFGRIAQYAGLIDLAVTYYRDCLRLSDEDSDDVQKLTKKHAAFNLHLIYRDVGENELAMKLINNYLSI
jgi:tetratricopeptide (TPR) repeat protein